MLKETVKLEEIFKVICIGQNNWDLFRFLYLIQMYWNYLRLIIISVI